MKCFYPFRATTQLGLHSRGPVDQYSNAEIWREMRKLLLRYSSVNAHVGRFFSPLPYDNESSYDSSSRGGGDVCDESDPVLAGSQSGWGNLDSRCPRLVSRVG